MQILKGRTSNHIQIDKYQGEEYNIDKMMQQNNSNFQNNDINYLPLHVQDLQSKIILVPWTGKLDIDKW